MWKLCFRIVSARTLQFIIGILFKLCIEHTKIYFLIPLDNFYSKVALMRWFWLLNFLLVIVPVPFRMMITVLKGRAMHSDQCLFYSRLGHVLFTYLLDPLDDTIFLLGCQNLFENTPCDVKSFKAVRHVVLCQLSRRLLFYWLDFINLIFALVISDARREICSTFHEASTASIGFTQAGATPR